MNTCHNHQQNKNIKTMDFKKYLEKLQLSNTTINGYLKLSKMFLDWLKREGIELENIRYNDMLTFIRSASNEGQSKRYINEQLTVVRHYFNYLIRIGKIKDNVAASLYIKGVSRRIPHDLLEEEKLSEIYEKYPTEGPAGKRNKVIIGIMIYQGLNIEELSKLEPEHINLKEGKIYVPGGRRSNSRILPLAAHQVLELHNYINKTRPLILGVAEKETDKLFTSIGKSKRFGNIIEKLLKKVQKYVPEVKSARQIRMSVITYWLEKFNLREVQYMAGHRYVSSTEKYLLTCLDDLQKDLDEYHPL